MLQRIQTIYILILTVLLFIAPFFSFTQFNLEEGNILFLATGMKGDITILDSFVFPNYVITGYLVSVSFSILPLIFISTSLIIALWNESIITASQSESWEQFIKLVLEKQIIGFLQFSLNKSDCDIISIGVTKKFQKMGHGKLLVEYLKSLNLKNIFVEVSINNINQVISKHFGYNSYIKDKTFPWKLLI